MARIPAPTPANPGLRFGSDNAGFGGGGEDAWGRGEKAVGAMDADARFGLGEDLCCCVGICAGGGGDNGFELALANHPIPPPPLLAPALFPGDELGTGGGDDEAGRTSCGVLEPGPEAAGEFAPLVPFEVANQLIPPVFPFSFSGLEPPAPVMKDWIELLLFLKTGMIDPLPLDEDIPAGIIDGGGDAEDDIARERDLLGDEVRRGIDEDGMISFGLVLPLDGGVG